MSHMSNSKQLSTDKSTARPWGVKGDYIISELYGQPIAQLECHPSNGDAELIVRAVNEHDSLVKTLEACLTLFDLMGEDFKHDKLDSWQFAKLWGYVRSTVERAKSS